jgi:hypothetical protein
MIVSFIFAETTVTKTYMGILQNYPLPQTLHKYFFQTVRVMSYYANTVTHFLSEQFPNKWIRKGRSTPWTPTPANLTFPFLGINKGYCVPNTDEEWGWSTSPNHRCLWTHHCYTTPGNGWSVALTFFASPRSGMRRFTEIQIKRCVSGFANKNPTSVYEIYSFLIGRKFEWLVCCCIWVGN